MTTENSALMEALEPTWANRELANVIRNLMRQGGWGLDADAHDWRSDHPLLQAIATLSRLAPLPAEREADGEAVRAKPWYETDAHRDLSRIIPDMEGKIADAEKRFAHCLPDHLFAPLKASITELRVLRHELSALSTQSVSEQGEAGAVAWVYERDGCQSYFSTNGEGREGWEVRPLYATPQPTEREHIVAWLRQRAAMSRDHYFYVPLREAADAIEAGEHLAGEGDKT